ncbi:hypothetical protein B1VFA_010 [Rhizobium phage B1VFA]|nr:hypothetical protein B1VFA_010 [Rhizobium phage B1VFA]
MSDFLEFMIILTSFCIVGMALVFAYKAIDNYGSNRDWWI